MSLILRLNLAAVMVFFAVLLIGVVKTIHTTAEHIKQEVNSSFELAQNVIDAQIQLLKTYPYIEVRPEKLPSLFDLEQFKDNKYLEVELIDTAGKRIASNQDKTKKQVLHLPAVLKRLLATYLEQTDHVSYGIDIGNIHLGDIVLHSDQEAELKVLWFELLSTLAPVIVLFLLISLGMTVVVSFVIKPVLELVKTVHQNGLAQQPMPSGLSRLHHLLGLPEHLKGISHELKHSSRKVHDLNYRILHLQEEERRRISAELHDELGQHLTAIRFESAAIETARSLDEAKQSAEAIDAIGREMKEIVRSMLERLHPPELDSMGLQATLTQMIGEWQIRHPANTITFDCQTDCSSLTNPEQLSLYRIVQEALTNISRHAGIEPINVDVSLRANNEYIALNINDNGQGCDLTKPIKGFGLKGMRERVKGLSGLMNLTSSPGNGMNISVEIPVKGECTE